MKLRSKKSVIRHAKPTWQMPGVYFLIHQGEVVYVGKSIDVPVRLAQHRASKVIPHDSVFVHWTGNLDVDLDTLERAYIRAFRPPYNGGGKSNGATILVDAPSFVEPTP